MLRKMLLFCLSSNLPGQTRHLIDTLRGYEVQYRPHCVFSEMNNRGMVKLIELVNEAQQILLFMDQIYPSVVSSFRV